MNRANPADLRAALALANTLARVGIDFVPIPVIDQDDKNELAMAVQARLAKMEKEADE